MSESFLESPSILTDDDAMELLTFIFRQPLVQRKPDYTIADRKKSIEAKLKEM